MVYPDKELNKQLYLEMDIYDKKIKELEKQIKELEHQLVCLKSRRDSRIYSIKSKLFESRKNHFFGYLEKLSKFPIVINNKKYKILVYNGYDSRLRFFIIFSLIEMHSNKIIDTFVYYDINFKENTNPTYTMKSVISRRFIKELKNMRDDT